MGCIIVDLQRQGSTPTPSIQRVGATPTAELDYLGGVPMATLVGASDVPTATLEHLGGISIDSTLLCHVGNDTLTLSESALSFTNDDVGVVKTISVTASSDWSVDIIDPSGLFVINKTSGVGGVVGKVSVTLSNPNTLVTEYSASVVFKSRGLRRILTLSVEAGADTYTRLTYIECDGQQYINTGYVVKDTDVIEMYYESTSSTNSDKILFGAVGGGGYLWYSLYSNTAYLRFGHTESASFSNATSCYTLKTQKASYTIGNDSGTLDYTAMPTVPLFLFARNSGGAGAFGECRCTYFSITDGDGNKVMELRPYKRDRDGAIGMLDVISNEFYESETSVAFIGGSEVHITDGYEVVDYISFNADKVFDAGIIDSTYSIDTMFKRSTYSSACYMYGHVTSPHTATVAAYLSNGGTWRWGSGGVGKNVYNNDIHTSTLKNGSIKLDVTTTSFTKSTFTTASTLIVGGRRSSAGDVGATYKGDIWHFRINDADGNYIVDWCPCRRESDGVEGFWDCVTQTFIAPTE